MDLTEDLQKQAEQALYEFGQTDGMSFHTNPVSAPAHYTYGTIEVAEFLEAIGIAEDFYRGNIIKYTVRYPKKGGLQDVRKALQYNKMLADFLEKKLASASDRVLEANLKAQAEQSAPKATPAKVFNFSKSNPEKKS